MTAAPMTNVNPFVQGIPMASTAQGNDTSGGQAAGISANDFLTLLVTEMKNQDPTAQTDPNEYINQLVQVNSLEQLIEINQNLSSALGTSSAGLPASESQNRGPSTRTMTETTNLPVSVKLNSGSEGYRASVTKNSVEVAPGNLGVNNSVMPAYRISQALSGRK